MEDELKRKLLHMGLLSLAIFLPLLPPAWVLLGMVAGVLSAAWLVLICPHGFGRRLDGRVDAGLLYYPLSLLVLTLLFPTRLEVVAGAWAMMAAGDGAAAIVGRRIGGAKWRHNPQKTVAGTAAFVLLGALTAIPLMLWTLLAGGREINAWLVLGVMGSAAVTAVLAGLLESVRLPLDDNVTTPFASALLLWALADFSWQGLFDGWSLGRFLAALLFNALIMGGTRHLGWVRDSGAWAGGALGTLMVCFGGWRLYGLMFAFFVLGSLATRFGGDEKRLLGFARARDQRRGAVQALANTGFPLLLAMYGAWSGYHAWAALGAAAALAAALADTCASELGVLYGQRPVSPWTLREVAPGTEGAVSTEGTLFGMAGGVLLAALAALLGVVSISLAPLIVIGAAAGFLTESFVADAAHRPLGNNLLNVITTVVGGATAMVLYGAVG